MSRRWGSIRSVIGLAVIAVVWALVLRPQSLGGPVVYVVVRGSSMLPAYTTGDLVIVSRAEHYGPGDVVAYHVPAGEVGEGHLVIHRIVGGDGATGFILKGDNNDASDPWTPRLADVAGSARWTVPGIGRAIAFLHSPITAGALAAGIAVFLILVGGGPGPLGGRPAGKRSSAKASIDLVEGTI